MSQDTADPTANDELTRLEILRVFKKRFAGEQFNDSPFTERVVRFGDAVEDWDVPEIHHDVREAIGKIIKEIQIGQPSKIVTLTGAAGMGKTHLINSFRSPKRERELGYVLVGNSNHWKVQEFEACLLDWILDALLKPSIQRLEASPQRPHLLLSKIKALAFKALEQILERPRELRKFIGKKDAGFWGRQWARWFGSGLARFQQALEENDLSIFRRLHFDSFAEYVIVNFLPAHASKPFHRYVLKCLLLYIFPEEREKVIHWLRRQPVEQHFLKKLGMDEKIDMQYKVIDTIYILLSLFTPEVSRMIHSDPPQNRGLVFCFAFDQMEGRQELFDDEQDWNRFFGKLSELYNTLPNVFIMFTMTGPLRNKLWQKMERQFQHRISRDQKYQLHDVESDEVRALYRRRISRWLGDKHPETKELLDNEKSRYLPFQAEEITEFLRRPQLFSTSGNDNEDMTLRGILECIDKDFRKRMGDVTLADPRLEFLVFRNELREQAQTMSSSFNFTKEHLANVQQLLNRVGGTLSETFDIHYLGVEKIPIPETSLHALRLDFRHPTQEEERIRVFLVRLGHQYNMHIDRCLELLSDLQNERYFLWFVRPEKIDITIENRRPGQVTVHAMPTDCECSLQAMLRLLDKRDKLDDLIWIKAEKVLAQEFRKTYLGDMFQKVAEKLGVDPTSNGEATPTPKSVTEEVEA